MTDYDEIIKRLRCGLQHQNNVTLSTDEVHIPMNAMEELQEYKQAEEQGLLVKLPHKIGDVFYEIFRSKIVKIQVSKIVIDEHGVTVYCEDEYNSFCLDRVVFGETAFLTEEKAEKALEEANP